MKRAVLLILELLLEEGVLFGDGGPLLAQHGVQVDHEVALLKVLALAGRLFLVHIELLLVFTRVLRNVLNVYLDQLVLPEVELFHLLASFETVGLLKEFLFKQLFVVRDLQWEDFIDGLCPVEVCIL